MQDWGEMYAALYVLTVAPDLVFCTTYYIPYQKSQPMFPKHFISFQSAIELFIFALFLSPCKHLKGATQQTEIDF